MLEPRRPSGAEGRLRSLGQAAAIGMGNPQAEGRLMTRFLLDTTFIIDVLNNRRNRITAMKELIAASHELACCAVNVTEIYTGMRAAEAAKAEALLRSLVYLPVEFGAA